MKISYNWLKDYLNLTIDPHQLADRLSLIGLEVEEVIERRIDFPGIITGRILSIANHPNADKLKICIVNVGDKKLSIVCGAPNVASGQVVPVAKVGTSLPRGMKIQKTKIRGVPSEGMICSQAELALTDKSEGIWILPDKLPLGIPLNEALELQTDFIFDIAVTPNRPDCLSHFGVAREVGAILNQKFRKPALKIKEIAQPAEQEVEIRIDTPHGCPRYSARVIKNVKIDESPSWLVNRLEAVGMRSINNVVDITNYVLMETGHPLHAFDFNLIHGKKIIVRESDEGEKFTTLDDQERILNKGTVLICDAREPVAIGGIMGGLNSEVSSNTENILLESAYFNPESIQLSSRCSGLSTEASQRFERGSDPNANIYALNRATQLISELCGGDVCKGVVDQYPRKIKPRKVTLNAEKINNLLGTKLPKSEIQNILQRIELSVKDDKILIPTFRPDLSHSADLAEEVARLYGFDNITPRETFKIDYDISINKLDTFIDRLNDIVVGMGFQEVITNSMINSEVWEELIGKKPFPILNPISQDMDGLRNSLFPSLAEVIQYNRNRKTTDLKIFEINRAFFPRKNINTQPKEELQLVIALVGKRDNDLWYSSRQINDFYDIKGIVEALILKISLDNCQLISYSDHILEGDGLALKIDSDVIGFWGKLDRKIANYFEIEDDVFVAQLSVEKLFKHSQIEKKYQPIPRYPSMERDLALIINEGFEANSIIENINQKGGDLLTKVEIFDIYKGKQIPDGKKSLAFHLTFQSMDRTLTEEEVNHLMENIFASVHKSFQAKLRD